MSLSGSRKAGMLPRITSSSGGKASEKNAAAGSRRNSLNSTSVSLRSLGMGLGLLNLVERVVGERDEGVVEAGVLEAQLSGDDVVPGEDRGDRLEQVAGAGHHHLGAGGGDAGDLRQDGEQVTGQRLRR